ncbi:MAG: zeta toxin family protein [Candidatus Omnitrophica bacterium]|nr:zeta toxin family protein [Candidatus Omnitrophota bacterium]
MKNKKPSVYIIAGPNGAGKTTFAREFFPNYAKCNDFINADLIAGGLSPFSPETAALHAGKLLLEKIRTLAKRRSDFGFETTLAGITYLSLIQKLKKRGYAIRLFFLWIPTAELALARVRDRVNRGGHSIPVNVVRRRFQRGLANFFRQYAPRADAWTLFDNSEAVPRIIAQSADGKIQIENLSLFKKISKMGEFHDNQ